MVPKENSSYQKNQWWKSGRDFCVGLLAGAFFTYQYHLISVAAAAADAVAAETQLQTDIKPTQLISGVANTGDAAGAASIVENWEDGIDHEVNHHTKWVRGEFEFLTTEGWYKYERETKLKGLPIDIHQKHYCGLFSKVYGADAINQVNVLLDHGAGPFTNLGKRFSCDYEGAPPDVKMLTDRQVIAVDPLAPMYNKILTKEKVFNTLRTAYCPSEELTKCVGSNTVDFAVIVNALDHSKNALAAFVESLRTVRVGGLSCVYTMLNEATKMGGVGFHQWDFKSNESSKWIIENFQTKAQFNVDDIVLNYAVRIPTHDVSEGQDLFCYKKIGQVPPP